MAPGRSLDFDYGNRIFQIHSQTSLQCSTARRMSFSVESLVDLKISRETIWALPGWLGRRFELGPRW